MDRVYRENITKSQKFGEKCFGVARLSICLYSLLYFLNSIFQLPSQYLPVLRFFAVLFSVFGIVLSREINLRRVCLSDFFKLYAGVTLFSIVSSLYSPSDTSEAFENILFILLIGTTFAYAVNSKRKIMLFLTEFSICGLIVFFVLYSRNLLHADDRLGRTLTSGNLNQFALYIMLCACSAIILFFCSTNRLLKICSIILIIIDAYMIMLSGGRKYILTPAIMIFIFVLILSEGRKNVIKRAVLMIGIAVLFTVVWNLMISNAVLYNSIGRRFIEGQGYDDRLDLIRYGFKIFWESPIWGNGENSYSTLISQYMPVGFYSHNNYIELLVNYGLIGFSWYYYYYLKNTIALFKNGKKDILYTGMLAFLLSTYFLQTGIVAYNSSSLLFVFIVISFNVCTLSKLDNASGNN